MNENREQRRAAQKQATRRVKRYNKVLTLLLTLIVLCGAFAVSGSAASLSSENETRKATSFYNTITFDTSLINSNPDLYSKNEFKQFDFPNSTLLTDGNDDIISNSFEVTIPESTGVLTNEMIRTFKEDVTPNTDNYLDCYTDASSDFKIYYSFDRGINWTQSTGFELYLYETDYDFYVDVSTLLWSTQNINIRNEDNLLKFEFEYEGIVYTNLEEALDIALNNGVIAPPEWEIWSAISDLTSPLIEETNQDNTLFWNSLEIGQPTDNTTFRRYQTTLSRNSFAYTEIYEGTDKFYTYTRLKMSLNGNNFFYEKGDNTGTILFDTINTELHIRVHYSITIYIASKTDSETNQFELSFKEITSGISGNFTNNQQIPLMPDLSLVFPEYVNSASKIVYIKNIETTIEIENFREENIQAIWSIYYFNNDSLKNFDDWLISQLGSTTINYTPMPVYIPEGSFLKWLANTVDTFIETPIFLNVSIGEIIWFVIAISVLFAVMKLFAGG